MVLTTRHTATRRVLAVLTDTAVTRGHVPALLAVLMQPNRARKQTQVLGQSTILRSFSIALAPSREPPRRALRDASRVESS
jgi:IS4 transposase